jgi:hypothetical protein
MEATRRAIEAVCGVDASLTAAERCAVDALLGAAAFVSTAAACRMAGCSRTTLWRRYRERVRSSRPNSRVTLWHVGDMAAALAAASGGPAEAGTTNRGPAEAGTASGGAHGRRRAAA